MKSHSIRNFLFLVIVTLIIAGCSHRLNMTVLHINDFHSHLDPVSMTLYFDDVKTKAEAGGLARVGEKVKDVRNNHENVLFLSAGDAVQGTLYFTQFHGEPEIQWLNWTSCDAMVTGNHEFDRGSETLAEMIKLAEFPILAANVDSTNDPLLKDKILPYTVLDIDHSQVGIIGIVTDDTPDVSNPDPTLIFNDPATAVRDAIEELSNSGINNIIVLSHCGYEKDISLARQVTGIDLIVGGHTHTCLGTPDDVVTLSEGDYPTVVENPDEQPVYVVQAGAHGSQLGQLDILFDRKGEIIEIHGQAPFLVGTNFYQKSSETGKYEDVQPVTYEKIFDSIAASKRIEIVEENQIIKNRIAPFSRELSVLRDQVVAQIDVDFKHTRVPTAILHGVPNDLPEGSQLAPVVSDAMLWKAIELGLEPDLAIQNAGGVRRTMMAGDVTVGTVYEVLPFENTLFILELTGTEIIDCFESLMERIRVPDNDGAFPYTSNLRYTLDMWQEKGARLSQIELLNQQGDWESLEPEKTYRIATNAYLASGRDGYQIMGKSSGYRYDTGFIDAEIFTEYLQTQGPIDINAPLISIVPVKSTEPI